MATDLMLDPNTGDFVLDPDTHDLVLVEDADEIAQRVRATLDIRYAEMENLDPIIGADYSNMLGKAPRLDYAASDMEAAILAQVPEVVSVNDINFEKDGRHLTVTFNVTYIDENGDEQRTEGGYDLAS